jgi:hypothetical protein
MVSIAVDRVPATLLVLARVIQMHLRTHSMIHFLPIQIV